MNIATNDIVTIAATPNVGHHQNLSFVSSNRIVNGYKGSVLGALHIRFMFEMVVANQLLGGDSKRK